MKTIKVDGLTYYAVPEQKPDSCEGCDLNIKTSYVCKFNKKCSTKHYIFLKVNPNIIPSDICSEMYADMEKGGMPQGEIGLCLNHWENKYIIKRKVK